MIFPCAGRILFRHLPQGTALVGLLQLPPEVEVVEGAAYGLRLDGNRLSILPSPVVPPLWIEEHGWALSDWLRGAAWLRSTDPGAFTVRFVRAFPESNAWALAGATSWSLAQLWRDAAGHGWWDVRDGVLSALAPPCDVRSMALGQVLTQTPVWPNAAGELHTLCQVLSNWRPALLQFHQLLARAGRGEMTLAQAREQVGADPALRLVGAGTLDADYCRYLARLEERGGLLLDGPRTAAAYRAHELLAREVVAEVA